MSERRPAARASAARDNLSFADLYRPGTVAEIRASIPPESLKAIDETLGVAWLEFEHDHWLMDGTLAVLGREEAVECWRRSIEHLVEKPLLRPLVEGSLRLFGAAPGKLIKMVPTGWTLAYRDFCVPRFELVEDGHARIVFEDIAPHAFRSPGYLHCWHAVCLGLFDLEKPKDGRVDFEIDEARRQAVAEFHWATGVAAGPR